MKTTVKTIDVNCKEWFDRINGNSYFAGEATVNFGMKDEKRFTMPFQYGYSDSYQYAARDILAKNGMLPEGYADRPLWHIRDDFGVILRYNMQTGCKKRELMQYK